MRPRTRESLGAHMRSRFFPPACHCEYTADALWQACIEAGRHALDTLGHAQSERAYEDCMANYLYNKRIPLRRQRAFYQVVDGDTIPVGIADLEVDHSIIIELKAGHARITADHRDQLARYLRAAREGTRTRGFIGGVFLFSKDGTLQIWRSTMSQD